MENYSEERTKFDFLNDTYVQKHFAELNVELLRGRHVMPSAPAIFTVLDEHYSHLEHYYSSIYGLQLEKRTHDSCTYFYLEFPVTGKGRLSYLGLYEELDAKSTIVGCILSNLYFSKYFSYDKKYSWEDIRYEIEHGEHRDAYQQLFFNSIRAEHSDKEWETIQKQFGTVINFFNRIGLVEKEDAELQLHFTILPTIHRFIELYKQEVEHIDTFLNEIKL